MKKRNRRRMEDWNVGKMECWKKLLHSSFQHSFLPYLIIISFIIASEATIAQPSKIIDQVAAVVGNKIILKSDIEQQYLQYIGQGNYANEKIQCDILDQLLMSKLLLNQAILDSVEVTDAQVQERLDRNMEYFIQQFGSQDKLESFYGKTVLELKDEYRSLIREQLLTQSMQQKITANITASPADVKSFFESIPSDSLPYISAEVEYAQIVKLIPVSAEAKEIIKQKLLDYKKRIEKGEEFATLAVLYSQDGSAKKGGELGFKNRGDLVAEFEASAFRLKTGEISDVVETKFGFHLIQMIERRGERINVRHILLKPEIAPEDIAIVKTSMDSVAALLKSGRKSFADVAQNYSDDLETRYNGGNIVNQQNGTTRFESDQVDPTVFFQLDKLQPGEISNSILTTTDEGKQAYKIFYLKTRTNPHKANLADDYQRLQEAALQGKQSKALDEWVKKKKQNIYIHITDDYSKCDNLKQWMN